MRLKWLPVRLKRRRRGLGAARLLPRGGWALADRSALLRGAGQRQSLPAHEGVVGRWPPLPAWGTYSPASGLFRDATEESLASPSHEQRRPFFGLGRSLSAGGRGGHCVQWPVDGTVGRRGGRSHLALRSLVPEWPHPTRLETRTKECNMRASPGVANPSAQ